MYENNNPAHNPWQGNDQGGYAAGNAWQTGPQQAQSSAGSTWQTGQTGYTAGNAYQAGPQQTQNATGSSWQSGNQQAQNNSGNQWQTSGQMNGTTDTWQNNSYDHRYNNASYNTVSGKPQHHKSTFGKIMMAICMGLLFGLFAGAGFYAVQLVTGGTSHSNLQGTQSQTGEIQNTNTTAGSSYAISNPLMNDSDAYLRVLTTEETDITEVVELTMPSMVSITETHTVSATYWGQTYTQEAEASGSGIIIGETDDEYIIVTNNHVIEDADDMTITFINGEEAPAHLKGLDSSVDIAVISVMKNDLDSSTISQIKVAELGDSDSLVLGQNVIAIGNALGYGQSVTTGIVSALNREVTTSDGKTNIYIQTDAAINPGNSGGALLNMAGQVIGINSNKFGGSSVEGMGYAIPITSVREVINELMDRETLVMVDEDDIGYIGIYMQEVTPEISEYYHMPQGVYVSELVKGGGAEAAGIRVGDIIVGIEGNRAVTTDGLKRLLRYYAVGDDIEVTFMRNEEGEYVEHTLTVTLGEKPGR
ncbi:MAG: trypsin-like peptidase domain-containing protein [Lachnospiraceae bacterium]|nr:trypsin-like peptidase domain-containing protein [Lachnospiraceae bacterium]